MGHLLVRTSVSAPLRMRAAFAMAVHTAKITLQFKNETVQYIYASFSTFTAQGLP